MNITMHKVFYEARLFSKSNSQQSPTVLNNLTDTFLYAYCIAGIVFLKKIEF